MPVGGFSEKYSKNAWRSRRGISQDKISMGMKEALELGAETPLKKYQYLMDTMPTLKSKYRCWESGDTILV